ncbi:MAG: hypothetical protein MRY63_03100 [Neomegalonema sp.]|nr:hypothetical protein [Neomegalonema sp.]
MRNLKYLLIALCLSLPGASLADERLPADYGSDMLGPKLIPAPETAPVALAECPDDGPRLPASLVCAGRAVNYLPPEALEQSAPSGCDWQVAETALPGDEVVLFHALRCGEKAAALDFAGGARSASLSYLSSAVGIAPGTELVRLFTASDANPLFNIRTSIPPAMREQCSVQILKDPRFAGEGFEIAPSWGEPDTLDCGPFGRASAASGGARYWLLRGGYAIFVAEPAGAQDVNGASITVIQRR